MTKFLLALAVIALLVNACSPATAIHTSVPTQTVVEPVATVPAAHSEDSVQKVAELATAAPASDPNSAALIISGRPTATSLTISLVPATDMQMTITYGTENTVPQTITAVAKANTPIEIPITGLVPDTAYFYCVNGGEKHTFHTARLPGSTFTFDIQGDSHPERTKNQFDPDLYIRTLTGAASDEPDFYIAMGDDFSVDTLKTVNAQTVAERYLNQRPWLGLVDAPVFLVNGNHEQASLANLDGTAENVAIWAQTARNTYYPQPAPDAFYSGNPEPVEHIGLLRNYYAWEWGDALFVVIDPYWSSPQTVDNQFGADRNQKKNRDLWNVTLGETQYRWFRNTLETSTAKYKFVFAHHVNGTGRGGIEIANSYEWGDSANLAAHRPGWDKTIHQVMVDSGVTIFFQGHDHIFVRQQLDGVIYQTLPEPANPFYTYENQSAYTTGDKFPNSGRVRVTISPDGGTVDYIRSFLDKPDEIAFSYKITGSSKTSSMAPGTETTSPVEPEFDSSATQKSPKVSSHPFDVILGRPTINSITLSLLSATDQILPITFGTENANTQTISPTLNANTPQEITLTGLTPDTQYFYSIPDSEKGSFHTARSPGSSYIFTIQADSHLDSNTDVRVYQQTLANQRADRPDFVLDLGDTFMTDKYKPYTNAEPQYLAQRDYLSQVGQSAPLFLVLGNHDGEGAPKSSDGQEMSLWAVQMRTKYFPNPVPDAFYSGNSNRLPATGFLQDYYSWEWGDALFIVLDPYWFTPPSKGSSNLWNQTLGEAQYRWLKTTLESSHARWKFVFIHQLIGGLDKNGRGGVEVASYYEWGGHDPDGSYTFDEHRPGWGIPIHQLLIANHVTAVFHGHDHLFAKQELDGIIYQEVPQPGSIHPNNTNDALSYGYLTGDILGSPGYLRIIVRPDRITVEYVRSYLAQDEKSGQKNGQVDYSYSIPAS